MQKEIFTLNLKADVPVNPADIIFENVGTFEVTMYTEWDDAKNPTSPSFKMTASGDFVKGYRTVAADPVVIPLGSIVSYPVFLILSKQRILCC